MKLLVPACVVLAGLAACATNDGPDAFGEPSSASAELRDAAGRLLARAEVSGEDGLRVHVEAAGLAPGTYGVHIHAAGRCDPPGFQSAGAHWNPTNREHGTQNPSGAHHGDLPNLLVGTGGAGSFHYTVSGASLDRLMDSDGASVIVHAGPDDYRTDPSGNSGARIACGVLR